MIEVERYEDGYKPIWEHRVEDCYIWRVRPGIRTSLVIPGGPWKLRVDDRFSGHRTLREARIEAARVMGIASEVVA